MDMWLMAADHGPDQSSQQKTILAIFLLHIGIIIALIGGHFV